MALPLDDHEGRTPHAPHRLRLRARHNAVVLGDEVKHRDAVRDEGLARRARVRHQPEVGHTRVVAG